MICSGLMITYITVFNISRPSLPEPQARLGLVRIKALSGSKKDRSFLRLGISRSRICKYW